MSYAEWDPGKEKKNNLKSKKIQEFPCGSVG